ncbi:MAG TPA: hypothetical protein PKA64_26580 [Myxococcota bacterium]|nr:hypothetical protein [Myxococcota bacterium]
MLRLLLPLLLLSCDPTDVDDKDDDTTTDDTDAAETDTVTDDTDDGAGDSDDTGDTDTQPAPLVDTGGEVAWAHVISDLRVMAERQGFDLNGDGTIDNSLGSVEAVLNPILGQQYGSVPLYAGTWIEGLGPNNGVGQLTVLALEDNDLDLTDNFTGYEEMTPSLGGGAVVAALVDVAPDGTYSTVLPAGTITVGPISLPTSTPILIQGTITADHHEGRLGAAVPKTAVDAMVVQYNLPTFISNLLANLADIDADGDGTPESISAALRFDGVSCVLTQP